MIKHLALVATIAVLAASSAFAIKAPGSLVATAVSPTEIDLTWKDRSSDEAAFWVWRQEPGKDFSILAQLDPNTTGYKDTEVQAETAYSYKVQALAQGSFSEVVSATTPAGGGGGGGGGGGNNVWTPITGDNSYKLVFDDEFNGTALNTQTKWGKPIDQPDYTYSHNGGTMQMLAGNNSVHDGVLDMQVTRGPTPNGMQYGTAGLTTQGSTISGQPISVYWEARMKMMDNAYGLMSGFWTDTAPSWNFPESDFNEYWQARNVRSTLQNYHDGNGWVLQANYDTGQNLAQAYHVFGTWWTPTAMVFYIDGKETARTTTNVNKTNPMWYAILNACAGGGGIWPNNTTQIPNHNLIDYVHVYSAQPGAVAITPDANYGGPGDTGIRALSLIEGNKGEAFSKEKAQ